MRVAEGGVADSEFCEQLFRGFAFTQVAAQDCVHEACLRSEAESALAELERVAQELGGAASFHLVDVTSEAAVTTAVAAASEAVGVTTGDLVRLMEVDGEEYLFCCARCVA